MGGRGAVAVVGMKVSSRQRFVSDRRDVVLGQEREVRLSVAWASLRG